MERSGDMENFWKSTKMKVILGILALLVGVMVYAVSVGGYTISTVDFFSAITAPFQRASHSISEHVEYSIDVYRNAEKNYEDNRALRLRARFDSYEKASAQPLSRLMAYLCDYPLVTDNKDGSLNDDPDFRDYRLADARKKELQRSIVGEELQDFIKPSEIVCIARRSCEDEQYDIQTSWEPHYDLQYSRFAEYNLYYPKMRYLLFDMHPAAHRNYLFDNVRFLCALLLLANNEIPGDALQPGRVYVMDCENDTDRLSALLQNYDDRLLATQKMLESEIAVLKRNDPQTLTDKEAQSMFCTPTNIPMRPEKSFDEAEIYVGVRDFGLYADRPRDEQILWHEEYTQSKKGLANYLKQPKKSMRAAVNDVHVQSQNIAAEEKIHLLGEEQIAEFHDYLNEQETAAVLSRPDNLADPSRYQEQADMAANRVQEHLRTRMSRKTVLLACALALGAFVIGLVPAFFTGRINLTMTAAMAGGLLVLVLVCVIYLFFRRGKLRKELRGYNDVLKKISDSVRANMERYSLYLGHVCSLLKGNAVDNTLRESSDAVARGSKIYMKHVADIRELRAKWGLIFSRFLQAGSERNAQAQPFRYDYKSTVTYRYPINGSEPCDVRVEFLQKGNYVELPVDYIRRVTLRREELYD
ncbi:MAG: hypothetical protein IJ072_05860 [Oscillospiraceae bacterium]|nr:hypothetical protein [Oscillospiraceae bacterium]